ncbi:glycosyltransferase [Thermodesulfatator atlanticus]|uniref:glycosyltransferase n=1 Tax=Thermodesulfatator atlanticus TaxID=501497 RepID=UPI0003B3C841|nr:glycosyltransferase [Thermodesulfatator atlanticus]
MPSYDVSFVVFADDWGEHPSSCQHIFKYIVRDYPVVWVNTIGMRLPRLTLQDAQKAAKKLKRMFFTASKAKAPLKLPENLSVLQPFMIPYNKGPFRAFNKRAVINAVQEELKRRGLSRPILVTTVPNACDYIGAFEERRVVYYCVDDFAEWPGHEKDLVLQMEKELIKKADIFIATSEKLYHKLVRGKKPTFLLPHGLDLKRFWEAKKSKSQSLAQIPKPRVGYVGLIDARLNWSFLEFLVAKLKKVSFVFIGRNEIDLTSFSKFANFFHVGPVPYEKVPNVLQELDVLILPYLVNEFTKTINPLKLKEYLASGKPIVAAPLPEILKWKDYLFIAETKEDWEKQILNALKQKPAKVPEEVLAKEDWSFKAEKFLEICLS